MSQNGKRIHTWEVEWQNWWTDQSYRRKVKAESSIEPLRPMNKGGGRMLPLTHQET